MKELIKEAKTLEAAILLATEELKCTKDDLNIEVIQEPVKGIFGIVKMAKIKAVLKISGNLEKNYDLGANNDEYLKIKDILSHILSLMKIEFTEIKIIQEEESVVFEIKSPAEGLLIGHHGKTIESIQYLISKIVNQKDKEKIKFFIDIAGYLNKHKQNLIKIAENALSMAIETKEEVKLEPMNAYDRRIIHLHLKDHSVVKTMSQGEGSYRHIVISLK